MTSKVCSRCKVDKPTEDFCNNSRHKDGKHYWCKPCAKEYRKEYQHRQKGYALKTKYGITEEQYELLKFAQGNTCAICETELIEGGSGKRNSVCVDHDHETGEVRGLLCNHCNRALGLFKDDIDVLQKARQYIARSSLVEIS